MKVHKSGRLPHRDEVNTKARLHDEGFASFVLLHLHSRMRGLLELCGDTRVGGAARYSAVDTTWKSQSAASGSSDNGYLPP